MAEKCAFVVAFFDSGVCVCVCVCVRAFFLSIKCDQNDANN